MEIQNTEQENKKKTKAVETETTYTTPHHEQRKKQAERYKDGLESDVIEQWYEIQPDKQNQKGGKIIACSRTELGVNRQYVGREKEKPEFVSKIKKEGKFRA